VRGLAPRAPRIYRFRARWLRCGAATPALDSGLVRPALRSLPSVCRIFRSGIAILNPTSGVGGEFTLFY